MMAAGEWQQVKRGDDSESIKGELHGQSIRCSSPACFRKT
jgi:hypothetical protein